MDSKESPAVSLRFWNHRKCTIFSEKMTSFLRSHLEAFNWELDPIQDYSENTSKNNKNGRLNLHYLIAFSAIVALHLDSLYLWFSNEPQSMFHRKVFLKAFWKCSDVAYLSTVTLTILVFGKLTFSWQPKEKYCLRVNQNGTRIVGFNNSEWNRQMSCRILAFRQKARRILGWIIVAENVCLNFNYFLALAFNWENTVRDVLFACIVPPIVMYLLCGSINIAFYFLLIVKYSQLQQVHLKTKLAHLRANIPNIKGKHRQEKRVSTWARFRRLNQSLLTFFSHLRGYNAFWSYFLSFFLLFHTWTFVYLLFALILNTEKSTLHEQSVFLFFSFELFLILSGLTHACSDIVRNNVEIYKENVSFCYSLQKRFRLPVGQLIQMSKLISNYKGTRNGFHLLNQQIVDSKIFQMLIFYISRLFIKKFL